MRTVPNYCTQKYTFPVMRTTSPLCVLSEVVIRTRGAASYIASTTVTDKIIENWGGNNSFGKKSSHASF